MFKLEKEMRPPVRAWLEGQGYVAKQESYLPNVGIPDFLGCIEIHPRFAAVFRFVAVEMKLNLFGQALWQAKGYRHYCHFTYLAFPSARARQIVSMPTWVADLHTEGVGLVSVTRLECVTLIPAAFNVEPACFDLYARFKPLLKKQREQRWDEG